MDTQKLDQAYIANTYARFPVTIVKGKGSLVWDDTGKEYIDLSTGIAVDIFGVADEEWVAAVTKQLGTLQHISNLYYTEPCAKLAQMLCEKTGMKKVFFGNSGAEANECAIKAARKWSEEKKGKEYATIITLKNSFHGRTITTLAATGQDVFHHDFTPLTEGFVYAEPNDLADLEQLIKTNKCAAVMMEVVQGEGGVMPYGTGNRNRQCWNPQQRCQRNQIRQRQVAVPTGRHFAQSDPQHAYQQYDPQRNTHANPLEMAIIRRTKTANEHIQHSEFVRFG